jgi:ubiquinone/menaquinone biosynthesis C-methylase UbiE
MKSITHEEQLASWEREHEAPSTLLQNATAKPSSSVLKFADWLRQEHGKIEGLSSLEICCGKGRSVIWLAGQGVNATGLDFSQNAIDEAKKRAAVSGSGAKFIVYDATKEYPFTANSFDFAYDCFGSTDIEDPAARQAAREHILRVLKPGGFLMIYLLSTYSEYQDKMVALSPGPEAGSFIHPESGKFEKAFTEEEIKQAYSQFDLIQFEKVPKVDTYDGQDYRANHIYAVFQKPAQ